MRFEIDLTQNEAESWLFIQAGIKILYLILVIRINLK